jgi:hypothetical protein
MINISMQTLKPVMGIGIMNDKLEDKINILLEDIKDVINECQSKLSDDDDIDWEEFETDMEILIGDLRSYIALKKE